MGRRRMMMRPAPFMMMPRRRVVVVAPPPKVTKTKVVHVHHPSPVHTTTTVTHHQPVMHAQPIPHGTHTQVSMGVPVGGTMPPPHVHTGVPESLGPVPPPPVQIPGETHAVHTHHAPPVGSEGPEVAPSECKT